MNCGKITLSQFHRGLDGLGISGIQRLYLSLPEIESVMIQYRDPVDPTRVCWKTFENDIEQVFTTKVPMSILKFFTKIFNVFSQIAIRNWRSSLAYV